MTARRPMALLVALALAVAGCGLSADDEPHLLSAGDLPADLLGSTTSTTVPTSESPTTTAVTIYYLVHRDGVTRLAPTQREVDDGSRPRDRLAALLNPPTADEQAAGLLTSIPATTILLDTKLVEAESTLLVDLSRSLFDVQGQELRNAFAQLVWTATELDGVRRVRFLVEGEEFRAPDEDGAEQAGAVSRADYITLAPQ